MSVVGTSIPTLLNVLCKDGTTKDLDRHPGLTKLFADVLDFVFEFDYIKVSVAIFLCRPAIHPSVVDQKPNHSK